MSTTIDRPAVTGLSRRWHTVRTWLDTPTTTYYLLIILTAILVLFGLVMVLSASAVDSITGTEGASAFAIFRRQALFAGVGLVGMWGASRLSVDVWRRLALPFFFVALASSLAVVFIGVEINGNRNWLALGPIQIQPAEPLKLALVLVGALIVNAKSDLIGHTRHLLVPYVVPAAMTAIGLVLAGSDLGTALILTAIVVATLFVAGMDWRWFVGSFAVVAAVVAAFVLTSANRLSRFDVWLGRDTDPYGLARQPLQGRYALADGGWFGLGLGNSREKWSWLSEPHNDFIFAIIGEELGLPGTLTVLALFAALAYACFRLVARSQSLFVRIATAGTMAWLVSQALVNIGSVIGAIPVVGVPLPLVSSGGSSLITSMVALGMLMAFAKAEPGCARRLAHGPSLVRRTATVLGSGSRRRGR